jgi:hypothetical protein
VYKSLLFATLGLGLIQPSLLTANEISSSVSNPFSNPISNPMRPPAFALKKFQQEKNKNKPKVVVVPKKKVASKPLLLTSILYSSTRKIAIIDEKMLSVGDIINGAKLVSIKKNSARLIKNGKPIKLRLSNQSKHIQKTVVQKTMDKKK